MYKLTKLNMEYNAIVYDMHKKMTFKQRLNLLINRAVKNNSIEWSL